MRKSMQWAVVLLILLGTISTVCCITLWVRENQTPLPPPDGFEDSDLFGVWEARYWSEAVDRLVIEADGTFRQTYYERGNIVHETSWNQWWVERFPDGRVRAHFEEARYFADGGHLTGQVGYCDPFSEPIVSVEMIGEVILNVRSLPSGEIVLYHMWPCGDSGAFPLIGRDPLMFRRVDTS